jgi:hypothetical protein
LRAGAGITLDPTARRAERTSIEMTSTKPRPSPHDLTLDPRPRPALVAFAAVVAFSAFAGTVGLATGTLDMGNTLNQRLPLHSPVLGGPALALVVGVPTSVVAIMMRRRDRRADSAAVVAGALLIGWILVEVAFIRELSFLQPFYAGVGIVFIAIGRRSLHRRATR